MKIKTKKQMTHEEYAKYMIDKFGIASYERELIDNNIFDAPMEFEQTFTLNPMRKDDDPVIECSFKGVVIEEERKINEHTILNKLVVRYRNNDIYIFPQEKIDNFINDTSVIAFYMPFDDLTMTLIWTREKGLVE